MPIAFSCPACQEPYHLSDHLAGKQVRCRKCQDTFHVPAQAEAESVIPVVQAAQEKAPVLAAVAPPTPKWDRLRRAREDGEEPRQGGNVAPWLLLGSLGCLVVLGLVVGGGAVLWLSLREAAQEAAMEDEARRARQPIVVPAEQPMRLKEGNPPGPLNNQPKNPANKNEIVFPLVLQNGLSMTKAKLDFTDAIDSRHTLRKLYVVNLQAGRKYSILLQSIHFDAYLRLEDMEQFQLAFDDDSGGGPQHHDALIQFVPQKTADYRVIATTFAPNELGDFTLTIRDLAGPALDKGKGTNQGSYTITVTRIDLPAADKLIEDLVWTGQGDAFIALSSDGWLSRVSAKGWTVAAKTWLDRRCSSLALSAQGLVATLPDTQEVWLIDPVMLTVLKRIPAPGVQRTLSAPTLKVAFAAGKDGVTVLDLTKGLTANHFNKVPTQFARVSPDGSYYFAQGGVEQLCSYRIEGNDLIEHQRTERIAQNGQRICVSPDGKLVCLPSAAGNYGTSYGTKVYSADNFKQPLFTMSSGGYPRLVAFDAGGNLAFTQNADKQLVVYAKGNKVAEFNMTPAAEEPRQFVSHPQEAGTLLVLTDKTLQVVRLKGPGAGK